jgi:hypothetical protein
LPPSRKRRVFSACAGDEMRSVSVYSVAARYVIAPWIRDAKNGSANTRAVCSGITSASAFVRCPASDRAARLGT